MKREISLYLVFGVLTTAIGVGGYALLLMTGMHYFMATTLSWILAVMFAFLTNRKYVFDSKAKTSTEIIKEAVSFFTSRLGTWAMETVGLMLLIDAFMINQMMSKYIMSVAVIIMNYILSKMLVFRSDKVTGL